MAKTAVPQQAAIRVESPTAQQLDKLGVKGMLRRRDEMDCRPIANCHGGLGELLCRTVLKRGDSEVGIRFMHDDTVPAGVTIGEHPHPDDEEIYFVVEGQGTMILDGQRFPIGPGDVSLVRSGHSHGLINSGPTAMRLLVIGVKPA